MEGITGTLTQNNKDYLDSIKDDQTNKKLKQNQSIDQDAFLKILTTQLQYQDPLSPMDNKDFIAQMAQFTSVEQLTAISESNDKMVETMDQMSTSSKDIIDEINELSESISNSIDESSTANEDLGEALKGINETQAQILDELVKVNQALKAYETK